MTAFSRNIGLALKTFLYQIVMSLFGIMMYLATKSNTLLLIAGQASVIIFFLYVMSTQMYQSGYKMCEYDRGHNSTSSPAYGFLFALLAFLPTILLSAWTVITPPFDKAGAICAVGYVPFLLNKNFLQGMYIGIVQTLFPTTAGGSSEALAALNGAAMNRQCVFYLFGAIPGILSGGIGYLIGYIHFSKDKKKK
ncbi:MAG: hypothetical protein IKT50_00925 [Clostridia bacterium]|nr:hypothetical protein [Clostridia bacterium]